MRHIPEVTDFETSGLATIFLKWWAVRSARLSVARLKEFSCSHQSY